MKKKDLKNSILRLLMVREMHGYEIGRQLSRKGLSGQLSYIYQILSEMRKEELIDSIWKKSHDGKKRKVYSLSSNGQLELQTALRDLVNSIHEFYSDYLARLPPEKWLLKWEKMITETGIKEPRVLVFVVDKPSALRLYQYTLEYYCNRMKRDVYLVMDKSIGLDFTHDNLVVLAGNHTEIPLKRDFADIIIGLNPPRPEALNEAVTEFSRVVNSKGLAAIGYPNIEEQEDPLTIGAFIERIQYGLNNNLPDKNVIKSNLKNHFRLVKTTKIANFTFFIGMEKNPTS